jgi:nitroreductase
LSLIDVILSRRSIRRYEPRPIPEETLKLILEAGRLAPTAVNRQPWHFVVVTDPELKQQLSQARFNQFLKDAAAVIVGCGQYDGSPGDRWVPIDVTIAMQNMVIAAWALGVGSCWIGAFDEKEVKELLGIPENVKILALLSMGYPAEKPAQREKKTLESIVHYNKF